MTREEAVKRANEVREGIEKDVDDLTAHFKGGIYGEDGNGNWIVGYGVSGPANIVVTPDHVEFGSARRAVLAQDQGRAGRTAADVGELLNRKRGRDAPAPKDRIM